MVTATRACNMVGMSVYLKRYFEHRNNAAAIKEAEENWIKRNKKCLNKPGQDRTPRKFLAKYYMAVLFDLDQIDAELDWDFFMPEVDEA